MHLFGSPPPRSAWPALAKPFIGQWAIATLRCHRGLIQITGRLRVEPDALRLSCGQYESIVLWDDLLYLTQLGPLEQERLTIQAMQRATEAEQA